MFLRICECIVWFTLRSDTQRSRFNGVYTSVLLKGSMMMMMMGGRGLLALETSWGGACWLCGPRWAGPAGSGDLLGRPSWWGTGLPLSLVLVLLVLTVLCPVTRTIKVTHPSYLRSKQLFGCGCFLLTTHPLVPLSKITNVSRAWIPPYNKFNWKGSLYCLVNIKCGHIIL